MKIGHRPLKCVEPVGEEPLMFEAPTHPPGNVRAGTAYERLRLAVWETRRAPNGDCRNWFDRWWAGTKGVRRIGDTGDRLTVLDRRTDAALWPAINRPELLGARPVSP